MKNIYKILGVAAVIGAITLPTLANTSFSSFITGLTTKSTPASNDIFYLNDVTGGNLDKSTTFSNIESALNLANQTGTLGVAHGGTGAVTLTGLLSGNGTGAITGGATVNNSNWSGTALSAGNGGTGNTSYSVGDINVATGATTLSQLNVGASSTILQSNGSNPKYSSTIFPDYIATQSTTATNTFAGPVQYGTGAASWYEGLDASNNFGLSSTVSNGLITNSPLLFTAAGYLAIGSSTPGAPLSILAGGSYAATPTFPVIQVASSTAGSATSTAFNLWSNGELDIGKVGTGNVFANFAPTYSGINTTQGQMTGNLWLNASNVGVIFAAVGSFNPAIILRSSSTGCSTANSIEFLPATSINACGRLFYATNGNLGLGTSSPAAKLTISLNGGNDTNLANTPFWIASSTAAGATTTLFRVERSGVQQSGGITPTISTSTGIGSGFGTAVISPNDPLSFTITAQTGATPAANAVIFTVTLPSPGCNTRPVPTFSAANKLASQLAQASSTFATSTSASAFTLTSGDVALPASSNLVWNFQVECN